MHHFVSDSTCYWILAGWDTPLLSPSLQDSVSANEKQVNAARYQETIGVKPGEKTKSRLNLPCGVHRWSTIHTKVYDLTKDHVTGMISVAISERSPGKFDELGLLVAKACVGKLVILRTDSGTVQNDQHGSMT